MKDAISPIEEIIDEARNGRMVILVDDADRENEGDLFLPAQMVTPNAINFMATHGRGLICLALTRERVDSLDLEPMSKVNGTKLETAFTVSIEAREGVTTGISAADRAHTICVAIDAAKGQDDISTPGHIFPLAARNGGVLVRAGHTEAAVDLARLAGLNPSGVICEIMRDDGHMARLDDLIPFAQAHGLKIGTIRDLIAYRLRHDHNLERWGERSFISRWGGEWRAISFRSKAAGAEVVALIKGEIDSARPVLVRMHGYDLFTDALGHENERADLLRKSMELIAAEGSGLIVMLARRTVSDTPAVDFLDKRPDELPELREYGSGAQVLAELGVRRMILLTHTHRSYVALGGYDIEIIEERAP